MCWPFVVQSPQHLERNRNLTHKHLGKENVMDFQNGMVVGVQNRIWDGMHAVWSLGVHQTVKISVLLAAPPQRPSPDSSDSRKFPA